MILADKPHLVLLEYRDQVLWIQKNQFRKPEMVFIALTAEALQALDELEYPCYAVCDFVDTSPLVIVEEQYIREIYTFCKEIETYIGERSNCFRTGTPGILSGNYYFLQLSISSIARRAYIIKKIVTTFFPSKITVFQHEIDQWLHGWTYTRNPWDEILETISKDYGIMITFIPRQKTRDLTNFFSELPSNIFQIKHQLRRRIGQTRIWKDIIRTRRRIYQHIPKQVVIQIENNECKIIFANSIRYDWEPVIRKLKQRRNVQLFELKQYESCKNQWWSTTLAPVVTDLNTGEIAEFAIEKNIDPEGENEKLIFYFDHWQKERTLPPKIDVLGTDVFPYLIPLIKTLIVQGLRIIRLTDFVALQIIERIRPQMICFFNITLLSDRRLAYLCEKNGIHTVCYQHGFGYNVQIQPKDEGCDQACAEFVLSYGDGNKPRAEPTFPVKAKFIPVGSARIEEMQIKGCTNKKYGNILKIVWIAELTTHNTLGTTLTEDTKRYRIQTNSLELLSKRKNLRIIYRPLITQVLSDGTSQWVKSKKISNISIDAQTPLEKLILDADLIIADISSPTTWGEVLGLQKPLILFCDPYQTPIIESSITDLKKACCWCQNEDELMAAIRKISADPNSAIQALKPENSGPFLKKYILHEGHCAEHVVKFLLSEKQSGIGKRD